MCVYMCLCVCVGMCIIITFIIIITNCIKTFYFFFNLLNSLYAHITCM